MGRSAFTSLQRKRRESGLMAVVLPHTPRTATGTGGKLTSVAQVLFVACVHRQSSRDR